MKKKKILILLIISIVLSTGCFGRENKNIEKKFKKIIENSKSYYLKGTLEIINNDDKYTYDVNVSYKDGYVITTKVNYSNNKKLTQQKIYLNKKAVVPKIEVIDDEGNIKIKMTFRSINFNKKFNEIYFKEENNMKSSKIKSTISEIEDTIYPMYMPKNIYLASEDKISLQKGERVILTFLGDKPFTIIEETVNVGKEVETIDVNGEPTLLVDTVGSLNDNDIMWISNGVEYYATSETLNKTELLDVIKSISVMPVGK